MSPRLLADVVLVFHALFIAFAVLGGLIAVCQRGKTFRYWLWLHLSCATWAATVVIMGWTCPLTPLEQTLRQALPARGHLSRRPHPTDPNRVGDWGGGVQCSGLWLGLVF
jgi:Protein of Unknown function (DUF2784)